MTFKSYAWILPLIIIWPVLGAIVISLLPKVFINKIIKVALFIEAISLALGVIILFLFHYNYSSHLQFVLDKMWIPSLSIHLNLAIDGLSLSLLELSLLTFFSATVYSYAYPPKDSPRAFFTMILISQSAIIGSFCAQDLLLFFFFFELILIPIFLLISKWGGPARQKAAMKFGIFTLVGSFFILFGFLTLFFLPSHSFEIPILIKDAKLLPVEDQMIIFGLLSIGFAIKVPVFPLHSWLPDAHSEAPTAVSVILAAVVLKLGLYGFMRIAIPILPLAAIRFAPWMGAIGVFSILYGALACFGQKDLKRLVAYSSVSHMGFALLGIATLTSLGFEAAIFIMIAHGLITSMLFFLTNSIQQRTNTRDLDRLGGLSQLTPKLGWVIGFSTIASAGIPGLAGFWGEISSIVSSYIPALSTTKLEFRIFMVLAAIGTALAAGYLFKMFTKVCWGRPHGLISFTKILDINTVEWISWIPLMVLITILGIAPQVLTTFTNPWSQHLAQLVQHFI